MSGDLMPAGIHQRPEDNYFHATKMCKAANKEWKHYHENDLTVAFLRALSRSVGIPTYREKGETHPCLIITVATGPNDQRGTWVHPLVARNLAQWLSPEYAVAVAMLLEAHHNGQLSSPMQAPPLLEQRVVGLIDSLEMSIKMSRTEQATFIGQARYTWEAAQKFHELEMALQVANGKIAFAEATANRLEGEKEKLVAERDVAVGRINKAEGAYKERGKEMKALKAKVKGLEEDLTAAGINALKARVEALKRDVEMLCSDSPKWINAGSGAAYSARRRSIGNLSDPELRNKIQAQDEAEVRKKGLGVVEGGRK